MHEDTHKFKKCDQKLNSVVRTYDHLEWCLLTITKTFISLLACLGNVFTLSILVMILEPPSSPNITFLVCLTDTRK